MEAWWRDGHRDFGQLLRGGTVQMHVPLGDHGVQAHGGQAVQLLEAVGRRVEARVAEPSDAAGAHRDAAGSGLGGVGDDGDVDAPGVDGVQGVGQVELEGAAAHGRVVDVLGVHVQVVGEIQPAVAHRHGGGEQAVDVVLGQPGVFQRLDDTLALDLEFTLVGGVAGDVFVDAHNRGRPSEVYHGQDTSAFFWSRLVGTRPKSQKGGLIITEAVPQNKARGHARPQNVPWRHHPARVTGQREGGRRRATMPAHATYRSVDRVSVNALLIFGRCFWEAGAMAIVRGPCRPCWRPTCGQIGANL